jgi:glyoxylase I family protein
MPVSNVFAALPVADLAAARQWYEHVLGREPDMLPNEIEAAWQMTESGWIYLIVDREHAGSGLVTLLVDDLDAWLPDGAATDPIPGVGREFVFEDPDGNRLKLAQVDASVSTE